MLEPSSQERVPQVRAPLPDQLLSEIPQGAQDVATAQPPEDTAWQHCLPEAPSRHTGSATAEPPVLPRRPWEGRSPGLSGPQRLPAPGGSCPLLGVTVPISRKTFICVAC